MNINVSEISFGANLKIIDYANTLKNVSPEKIAKIEELFQKQTANLSKKYPNANLAVHTLSPRDFYYTHKSNANVYLTTDKSFTGYKLDMVNELKNSDAKSAAKKLVSVYKLLCQELENSNKIKDMYRAIAEFKINAHNNTVKALSESGINFSKSEFKLP